MSLKVRLVKEIKFKTASEIFAAKKNANIDLTIPVCRSVFLICFIKICLFISFLLVTNIVVDNLLFADAVD
jgi:hypothetical protein